MLDTTPVINRTIDAQGSFCPGPLMELIRGIRESQVGDVLAVLSSDKGSKIDIPRWVEKAGHRLIAASRHVTQLRSTNTADPGGTIT